MEKPEGEADVIDDPEPDADGGGAGASGDGDVNVMEYSIPESV